MARALPHQPGGARRVAEPPETPASPLSRGREQGAPTPAEARLTPEPPLAPPGSPREGLKHPGTAPHPCPGFLPHPPCLLPSSNLQALAGPGAQQEVWLCLGVPGCREPRLFQAPFSGGYAFMPALASSMKIRRDVLYRGHTSQGTAILLCQQRLNVRPQNENAP